MLLIMQKKLILKSCGGESLVEQHQRNSLSRG